MKPVWYLKDDGSFGHAYIRRQNEEEPSSHYTLFDSQRREAFATIAKDQVFLCNDPKFRYCEDMTSLRYLEEPNMLACLSERYRKGLIYTNIASVLIAVNPYETIPADSSGYHTSKLSQLRNLKPHVFKVAESSFLGLRHTNQSIVCCGESGSGKTESAKSMIRYLVQRAAGQQHNDLESRTLQSTIITESFGNAKTLRNHNSSRFAKFIKLYFEEKGLLAGAHSETYLLERSRVSNRPEGEQNFHVFYLVCSGLYVFSQSRKRYCVPAKWYSVFRYLNNEAFDLSQVKSFLDRFEALKEALFSMGISAAVQSQCWNIVMGILHLGNYSPDKKSVHLASRLLGLEQEELLSRLRTRNIYVGTETFTKTLTREEQIDNRNTMARTLYQYLFRCIIEQINEAVCGSITDRWIGILDVFGFESFQNNSFEQFCINYANECLQHYFNEQVLIHEQNEYLVEGIRWVNVNIRNNDDCVALFEDKKIGLFGLIDTTCIMPKGTPLILQDNVFQFHSKSKSISPLPFKRGPRRLGFTIHHYADSVSYNVADFLPKNVDTLHDDTMVLFSESKNEILSTAFASMAADIKQGRKKGRRFKSIGTTFSRNVKALIQTLRTTEVYFVRCLNPNSEAKAKTFNWNYVRPQIRNGGLIETLRILKYGYPLRIPYQELTCKIQSVLKSTVSPRTICQALVRVLGLDLKSNEFEIGLSKIFIKGGDANVLKSIQAVTQNGLTESQMSHMIAWISRQRWRQVVCAVRVCCRIFRSILRARALLKFKRAVYAALFLVRLRKHSLPSGVPTVTTTTAMAPTTVTTTTAMATTTTTAYQQQMARLKASIKTLSENLDDIRREKIDTLEKLQLAYNDLEDAKEALRQAKQSHEVSETEKSALREAIATLKHNFEYQNETLEKLQQAYDLQQAALMQAHDEFDSKELAYMTLHEEKETLQDQIEALQKRERTQEERTHQIFQRELEVIRGTFSEQLNTYQRKIATLEYQLKEANETISVLKERIYGYEAMFH